MSSFNIQSILRENIKNLTPYSSARHEYTGSASVFLDANENPYGSPLNQDYNRYPDPFHEKLKTAVGKIKGVPNNNTLIGNGINGVPTTTPCIADRSDQSLDIAIRARHRPRSYNHRSLPPTYRMYFLSANIHHTDVKKVPPPPHFQSDLAANAETSDENTKIVF